MDSERPPSLRSILTRIICTLVGLLLLYVLSVGPATYLSIRYPITLPSLLKLYAPLRSVLYGTPLEEPVGDYCIWCGNRAAMDRASRKDQKPPDDF